MLNLLELKEDFSRQKILICFNGSFSHSIIEELGTAAKRYLEGEQLGKSFIADVFAVYIEQTQNVSNYLKKRELANCPRHGSAIVVISGTPDGYSVCCGNSIRKDDASELTSYLNELNSLDADGLRKLYKQQLRKERNPESNGAGLGLIDMARRNCGKLSYKFDQQNEEFDFFSLFVTIKGE